MNGKAVHDTPAIQSLDRGLAILEAVAASAAPVPLKQLTDLIGIDRSSVFRLEDHCAMRNRVAAAAIMRRHVTAQRAGGRGFSRSSRLWPRAPRRR